MSRLRRLYWLSAVLLLLVAACTVGSSASKAGVEAELRRDESAIEAVLAVAFGEDSLTSWVQSASSGGCTFSGGRFLLSEMTLAGVFDLDEAYQAFAEAVGDNADVSPISTNAFGVKGWHYTGQSPLLAYGGVNVEDGKLTISVAGRCYRDD